MRVRDVLWLADVTIHCSDCDKFIHCQTQEQAIKEWNKENGGGFDMSMISELVKRLREIAKNFEEWEYNRFYYVISEAADTIEALSAKLAVANMERSDRYYGGGWKPISEYSRDKYDWVLIKYFDGEEECVPQVAELRSDGKWHVSTDFDGDFIITSNFDVRYFFDMQQLDRS